MLFSGLAACIVGNAAVLGLEWIVGCWLLGLKADLIQVVMYVKLVCDADRAGNKLQLGCAVGESCLCMPLWDGLLSGSMSGVSFTV